MKLSDRVYLERRLLVIHEIYAVALFIVLSQLAKSSPAHSFDLFFFTFMSVVFLGWALWCAWWDWQFKSGALPSEEE